MTSHQAAGSVSFSLFPRSNPSSPRPSFQSRRSESRERKPVSPRLLGRRPSTPQAAASIKRESSASPPRDDRRTGSPIEFGPSHRGLPAATQASRSGDQPSAAHGSQQHDALGLLSSGARAQQPKLTIEVPRRPESADPPLVQPAMARTAGASRAGSLSKRPSSSSRGQQPTQSIFPPYNPDLPLQQQHYAPTQMSPTRVPRAVISRQSYYEDSHDGGRARTHIHRVSSRTRDPPVIPKTSTMEQLKDLWKVTNGWKASTLEGRVFCLSLTQQRDAPVYLLSSSSQPFYSLRLDPTSASAYVSLSRHDPTKPLKVAKPTSLSSTNLSSTNILESKYWQEALSTTLEDESRRHRPNDGLVCMLMPSAAARIVAAKPEDLPHVAAAERECARLVWDEDSDSYFLVHPALTAPFRVAVEHSPAWSRVEYTLEHHESPNHIAKLTRDGTGSGWLEIDTNIAAKVEAYYIVDVAVAALLLIAAMEDRKSPAATKTFDAPPASQSRRESSAPEGDDRRWKKWKKDKVTIQPFELDVESQDEGLGKEKEKDKRPFLIRAAGKLAKGLFRCFIGMLTIVVGCIKGPFLLVYKLVGSKY